MGSTSSSESENGQELTSDEIDDLKSRTHFSGHELRDWHEKFLADYPAGKITKPEFIDMYCKLLPDGDSYAFASHVFRAYDRDASGTVDFKEFIHTLSITTRGTPEEKLKWAFRLYDLNRDGVLAQKEIVNILMSIYQMRGIEDDGLVEKAEDTAFRIFAAMDKDQDYYLSQDEFIEGIDKCGAVADLLGGI